MFSDLAFVAQEQLPELPAYGFDNSLGSLLSLAITVVLPIVVGLVTRVDTPAGVKAVLLFFFAATNSVLTAWLEALNTSATFEPIPVIFTTVINFLIAVAMYFGLWRPTGVTQKAQESLVK